MMAIRERAHVQWRSASVVAGTSVFGIPVGLYVLATFAERPLTIIIAFVVLAFTIFLAVGRQITRSTRNEVAVGVTSGVLLGATGMNGPPLVAAFQAMQLSPPGVPRDTAGGLCRAVGPPRRRLPAHRPVHRAEPLCLAGRRPALLVGWLIGEKVFHRLADPQFRRLVLITMSVSAVLAFVNAFV